MYIYIINIWTCNGKQFFLFVSSRTAYIHIIQYTHLSGYAQPCGESRLSSSMLLTKEKGKKSTKKPPTILCAQNFCSDSGETLVYPSYPNLPLPYTHAHTHTHTRTTFTADVAAVGLPVVKFFLAEPRDLIKDLRRPLSFGGRREGGATSLGNN